jgi:hypothetical protein
MKFLTAVASQSQPVMRWPLNRQFVSEMKAVYLTADTCVHLKSFKPHEEAGAAGGIFDDHSTMRWFYYNCYS